MFLIYNSIGLGLVEAQVASEIVREVGRKNGLMRCKHCIKISVTFGVRRS